MKPGIAAGRNVPMMVISAGTRNHFALDLGLAAAAAVKVMAGLRIRLF